MAYNGNSKIRINMVTNLEIGYNGRLGNQMFQYAACYDIAKKLDTDFVIPKFNVDNEKHDGCWDFSNNKWIPYRFRVVGWNIISQSKNINWS